MEATGVLPFGACARLSMGSCLFLYRIAPNEGINYWFYRVECLIIGGKAAVAGSRG